MHESMPTDMIWQQYGVAIMTQYPEEEWERRIGQIPRAYRDYIRARIWWHKEAKTTNAGAGATQAP